MKNKLGRINRRLKNAEEKLLEHENTDQKLSKMKLMEVKDWEIMNTALTVIYIQQPKKQIIIILKMRRAEHKKIEGIMAKHFDENYRPIIPKFNKCPRNLKTMTPKQIIIKLCDTQ